MSDPADPRPDQRAEPSAAPQDPHVLETGRLAELGLQSAALVHELRQPLFAVRSLAQLARASLDKDPADLDRAREHLDTLLAQLSHLDALATRYAGSSRRPGSAVGPVLLAPPVTAAVQLFGTRARSEGKALELDLGTEAARVEVDPVAVQQVVANLVGNALDAAAKTVRVELRGSDIRVSDDGPEVDPAVLARAFEPFFTTKPPGRGTGLGLSVARSLVVEAGGSLQLRRERDRTVVDVHLPPHRPAPGDGDPGQDDPT